MSENNCAVYVHVNLINGKKYFGITVQEPEARWGKDGKGYSYNEHFTNAIKKYGWNNFAHYVLYRNIPIKIAKNIEEMLIQEHMSYNPRFGYNKTMGGELEKHTKETRGKISEAMKGREFSKETRKKISEAKKGHDVSEKTREAVRNALSKPVIAINTKTGLPSLYFKSTISAERLGFNNRHISECCNGKRKTHKGYVWRYVEEVNKDDTNSGQ